MSDGNDQEQLLTGERLLREIGWVLDRHGYGIIERHPTYWILRDSSGRDLQLEIQNLIMALGRFPTLARQRRALTQIVAGMLGGGGTGGAVSKE
jgi:hypothetical protein